MELHGSLTKNLISALQNAKRLSGKPIHPDTLTHWPILLEHAREQLSSITSGPKGARQFTDQLEAGL